MTEKPRVLALIPARGGSKGIPHKNLALLNSKPLIQWTIDAAKAATVLTDIVVSTDDDTIRQYAQSQSVDTLMRPTTLACDTAPMNPTITHAIKAFRQRGKTYNYLCLLQPTSPLRTAYDIDTAMATLQQHYADAAISVTALEHNPLKSFRLNHEGFLTGIANNQYPFMRRQDLPPVYEPNGALFIVAIDAFEQQPTLLQPRTAPYLMPAERSVDIDTQHDLAIAAA